MQQTTLICLLISISYAVTWDYDIYSSFNVVDYKYHGKHIGINGLDAGLTWTWYEANSFCYKNFGTSLATWTNNDDQSNAAYAQWSLTSNSTWI